jgi:SAM-dependent methyltransferase
MDGELLSLSSYIDMARRTNTHSAKAMVLSKLLEEVFNVKLENLLPGVEKRIGNSVIGVRGSIDLIYSNVIFEIKVNLERELDDAKRQLKKYFQAMLEARPQERFVGIATDVINYRAFIPVIDGGIVGDVKEVASINISEVPSMDAVLWLDSYIFSKTRIKPTANDLKFRFGPGSPTYALAVNILSSIWELVKDEEDVKLKYELWSKTMEIVYGSTPEVNAFIDQTYLVTLVKLILYLRLSGDTTVSNDKVLEALTGEYFAKYGILNLVEEDFFSWIIHGKIINKTLELITGIVRELQRYDLTQIDEDFFKEIYQEIVERGQRHRVGEYYTPEWVTELTLNEVMDLWWKENKEPPRILDPACGSGTFLCNAIHILKNQLMQKEWKEEEILSFILAHVVGVDVNPLAVAIARANYLMALGELLNTRKGPITIPIYVADSIKLPKPITTLHGNIRAYEYIVNDTRLQIPVEMAKDRIKLGKLVTAFKEAINSYRFRKNIEESIKVFERALQNIVNDAELQISKFTLNKILSLIDKGRDSIWIYMLSNIYIPAVLSESKFDIIVGNPPWIAMRYIENKEYQDFVKSQFFFYGLLSSDQVKLFTHIEIATLFFCIASDLYLKDGGIIGFVMPRSVLTGAFQHAEFKKFKKPAMNLRKIIDLEDVLPLFNVPTCVLIAVKGGKTTYPVPAKKLSGKLPEKNIKLDKALSHLKTEDYSYQPLQIPRKKSFYHDYIREGATIVPRNLWFIDFVVHPTLGIDIQKPYCKTSELIAKKAKEPWKNATIEGNVEKEFIYATVISEDLIPFKCSFKPVVLPIESLTNRYILMDVDELRERGYVLMASWLEKAQKIWEEKATKRSLMQYPRIISWLDYMRKLCSQNPSKRYVVIYNSSGTNIVSCVIDKQNLQPFHISKFVIMPKGFIAEAKTMFYETNNDMESHYLCAILNSDVINEEIKSYQTRGLFGERDIIRRPFMLPIPKFDPKKPIHRRLAELSKICHEKASRIKLTKKGVAGRRKEVREAVKEEIAEINKLVSQLLNIS